MNRISALGFPRRRRTGHLPSLRAFLLALFVVALTPTAAAGGGKSPSGITTIDLPSVLFPDQRLTTAPTPSRMASSALATGGASDSVAGPLPGICTESDRFGFAFIGASLTLYDVKQLHAGWYQDFWTRFSPPRPAGLTYAQTIRLSDDGPFQNKACSKCPTWDDLAALVEANPGSLWLIGNEPDAVGQDNIMPESYARLYHAFYTFLKAEDPTCLVAIAGVVQPTPLRLDYLDLILQAYRQQHNGAQMPIDVWNTHNYVLREKRFYPGCPDCWGCDIPPGIDANFGILYNVEDSDLLDPSPTDPTKIGWKQQLVDLRQHMTEWGYGDVPLVLSEYGILMPEVDGFDEPRVRDFMLATFDWLRSTANETGYPHDGYRLVQAWNWYSIDDANFGDSANASHLFDPANWRITALGAAFRAYTASLTDPFPGSIDLQAVGFDWTPLRLGKVTVTARIRNNGAQPAQTVLVRFERGDGRVDEVTVPTVAPGAVKDVSVVWSDLELGSHYRVTVTVTPEAQVVDCDPSNNRLTAQLLVTDQRFYLPMILRGSRR